MTGSDAFRFAETVRPAQRQKAVNIAYYSTTSTTIAIAVVAMQAGDVCASVSFTAWVLLGSNTTVVFFNLKQWGRLKKKDFFFVFLHNYRRASEGVGEEK